MSVTAEQHTPVAVARAEAVEELQLAQAHLEGAVARLADAHDIDAAAQASSVRESAERLAESVRRSERVIPF